MEPRYLLDTNICIHPAKKPEEVLRRFRKLRPGGGRTQGCGFLEKR